MRTTMSRAQGHLSVFSIAVIFLFVFAMMYQAVEFAENPNLPEDPAEDSEKLARTAVWERVNQYRAEHDRFTASSVERVQIDAQRTAEQLAEEGQLSGPIASGTGISGELRLPNPGARCTQFAVPVDVQSVDTVPVPMTVRDEIATEALAGFESVDSIDVLTRGPWANNGIGVAITEDTAYVTYRSCLTRRFSP